MPAFAISVFYGNYKEPGEFFWVIRNFFLIVEYKTSFSYLCMPNLTFFYKPETILTQSDLLGKTRLIGEKNTRFLPEGVSLGMKRASMSDFIAEIMFLTHICYTR